MQNKNLKFKIIFFLILFFGIFGLAENSKAIVFPGSDWQKATPESQGVNSVYLNNALSYFKSQSNDGAGTDEMVIVRNGYVIWEGPKARTASHVIYSVTKTFTSSILGVLIQNGKIGSVEDLATKYLPEADDQYSAYSIMKLKHLASMTSGYDSASGDCWSLFLNKNFSQYDQCVQGYTNPGASLFNPGTAFKYHDPAVHLLGKILTKQAGISLKQYFQEKIAGPLGISNWNWTDYGTKNFGSAGNIVFNNPAGTPGGISQQGGVSMRPIDFARYGLLYLNRGNWNGQQILNSAWVDQATINQVPLSLANVSGFNAANYAGRYGFLWWTNGIKSNGSRPWPSAPPKTYAAHGAGRNYNFIIPEWNMVIARMAPWDYKSQSLATNNDTVWEGFFNRLASGVGSLPPAGYSKTHDLISMHFDHANDPDDALAAAANRSVYGELGITSFLVVSGATGINGNIYVTASEPVMDTVWGSGQWLNAHSNWNSAVQTAANRWENTLNAGGDIWIAEGGQSDFSADVVREIKKRQSGLDTAGRIHLIQHGAWNEDHTTSEDLSYVKSYTDYRRIDDGNEDNDTADLRQPESAWFIETVKKNSKYGAGWRAAFDYYMPRQWSSQSMIDFSDTVELLYILDIPKSQVGNINDFANEFLVESSDTTPPAAPSGLKVN